MKEKYKDGFASASYEEMKELIASQAMLDMIFAAKDSSRDYYVTEVIKAAEKVRRGYMTAAEAEEKGDEE